MSDPRAPLFDSTAPKFYIGGRERIELARDLNTLRLEEDVEGMKRLSFTLGAVGPQRGSRDEQLLYLDGQTFDFGSEIEVAMGPASRQLTVFKGRVSGIQLTLQQGQSPEVRVLAEDALMDLRMTRRFKTYEDMSDADILREIAGQHGLQAQADVQGPTYSVVQQWNQSDLAFLRERAQRLQADVWVHDGTLHLASRDGRGGSRLTLVQGNDLLAVEIRADLAHQRTEVKFGGFDEAGKDAIDEDAGRGVVSAESSGGRNGPEVLESAFGERVSHWVRQVPLKDDEARDWAKAEMLRRARSFIGVRGLTLGSAAMIAGSVLRLERVGPLFEGDGYYVTRVAHSFDTRNGFRTEFEAQRAWIGRAN